MEIAIVGSWKGMEFEMAKKLYPTYLGDDFQIRMY